jgi:triacylglycerol lipase|tara:strand:- start:229 stop:1008 length:780 start_codon:yes stop_codon:yes gene_type:complete
MISKLSFKERSVLFAKLAQLAYLDEKAATKHAKKIGFTTVEFYNLDGAQTYRFMNKHDLVIACRGTEPTEFNDIKADLKATPVIAETVSRVHRGFKQEVDELWPMVLEDLKRKANDKKKIWFCGHSLGAAMATIMASRCHLYPEVEPVQELYTYGSPRVGWHTYVNSLGVTHHRWKNNNDIVTTVPMYIMGYKHHGTEHYLNAWGNVRTPTGWQLFKDKMRGLWMGIKQGKIDSFSDHSMVEYVKHLEKYADGKETSQL